jgi:uracil-DNA glycosylase
MPERNTSSIGYVTSDYEVKISQEAALLARRSHRVGPEPLGDPLSAIVLVMEGPTEAASDRLIDALRRSLAAVKLDRAYVTWFSPHLLEEILSLEPGVLVAVGPTAARSIDLLNYPLAKTRFLETPEGSWFTWTEGALGLRLPALAPALDDAGAKRHFWRTFLTLRALDLDKKRGYRL